MFQWSPLSGKSVLPGNDNNVINQENEKLTFCRGWPVVAGWSFDFKLFFNPFSSAAVVNTSSPWWEMGNAKAGVREALFFEMCCFYCLKGGGFVRTCQDGLKHFFFPCLPVWQRVGGRGWVGLKLFWQCPYGNNTFRKGSSLSQLVSQSLTRVDNDGTWVWS